MSHEFKWPRLKSNQKYSSFSQEILILSVLYIVAKGNTTWLLLYVFYRVCSHEREEIPVKILCFSLNAHVPAERVFF